MWPTCPVAGGGRRRRIRLVYSFNLATGARIWTYNAGAPVNSSPSVPPPHPEVRSTASLWARATPAFPLQAATRPSVRTEATSGSRKSRNPASDPTHMTRAGFAGRRQPPGGNRRDRGLAGANQDALDAADGSLLSGFPWFQADSDFSTPAWLTSTATAGLRSSKEATRRPACLRPELSQRWPPEDLEPHRQRRCCTAGMVARLRVQHQRDVQSSRRSENSSAVRQPVGVVLRDGRHYHQSDPEKLNRVDSHCNLIWSAYTERETKSSPALATCSAMGHCRSSKEQNNGSTGSVYASRRHGAVMWKPR